MLPKTAKQKSPQDGPFQYYWAKAGGNKTFAGIKWRGPWFVKTLEMSTFLFALVFQTPGEEVFGPQKHTYNIFSGGIWKPRVAWICFFADFLTDSTMVFITLFHQHLVGMFLDFFQRL